MKPLKQPIRKFGYAAAFGAPFLAAILLAGPQGLLAQTNATPQKETASVGTNAAPAAAASPGQTNAPASAGQTNAVSATTNAPSASPGGTNSTSAAVTSTNSANATASTNAVSKDIQVSFQGANVDMVCQWLAQNTGKSVVKHPKVQCQLTITSPNKINPRDAVTLIYRALALEGFTVTETAKSILIGPDDKELKISPELIGTDDVPEGKQKLVKVFALKHMQAADLKEKIKAFASEKATIDTDERSNRIIVTDFNDNIALIKDLIAKLDTDNPADIGVRVIPLKHGSARDLARELNPLYQRMNNKGPKDIIEVSANERSNSLMIMSSQSNFEIIEKLVAGMDTEGAKEKIMQTFPLKNADPQDLAKQLQDLFVDEESRQRPWYYYSPSSPTSTKMTVVGDRRRNAVIVQAIPSAMEQITDMIKKLDAPVEDNGLAPKIYPLKYVNAGDIEDILNELFLKKEAPKRRYWFDDEPEQPVRDVGRLFGKVRITSESHANAIIVTANSQENLSAIEEILKQLDIPSEAGESTLRVQLKFAKASTVANSVNILFAKSGAPPLRPVAQNGQQNTPNQQQQQQQPNSTPQINYELELDAKEDGYYPWLGGQQDSASEGRTTRPVSDLVGRVRAVADYRSNSLLISANMHFFPQVLKLIEEMDAPTAQVLIEARIVEVSSDFMDRLGVRWSPNGDKVFTSDDFDGSVLANGKSSYVQSYGGAGGASPISAAIANATRSGILDSSISMDFLIQFLRRNTDATVLAEPQISIADNEMGRLFVGSVIPFIDNTLQTDQGGLNQSFSYKNVGVTLEVTPHINIKGDVALRIRTESSSIQPGQTLFGGAIIDTRNFRTDLTAKNGQTLVLGGIIQKQVSDTVRKVPLLGDIPVLGYLFKKRDKSSREVELMVFLRPRIARTPEEVQEILNDVEKKAPLVHEWLEKNDQKPEPKKDKKSKK